jgi:ankyrin repeat protein
VDARPLYYAAERGHKQAVELLVTHGATVNTRNGRHSETPQDAAARAGHKAVAEFLAAHDTGSPPRGN